MAEPKHTPTQRRFTLSRLLPVYAEQRHQGYALCAPSGMTVAWLSEVSQAGTRTDSLVGEEQREFAAYVERAVNSYSSQRELVGELVEALRGLAQVVNAQLPSAPEVFRLEVRLRLDRANRLLAKCEAGEVQGG